VGSADYYDNIYYMGLVLMVETAPEDGVEFALPESRRNLPLVLN